MSSSKRVGASRPRVVAAVAVAMLSACAPSMEAEVAKHRPAVEAAFAKMRALSGPVLAAPPLTEDAMALDGAKVVLDGEASNALLIRAEDLTAPEAATSDSPGATRAGDVATCGEALREPDPSSLPKGAPLFLADCARAEYVFVQRTIVHDAPQMIGTTSFQPGRYEGEVLLYRLADGTRLGGFRIAGANNEEVSAAMDAQGNIEDPTGRLASDLGAEVFVAIEDGIRKHVPGAIAEGR